MQLTKSQRRLRDLMSSISERCYSAGWMDGTDFRLWQFVADHSDDGT